MESVTKSLFEKTVEAGNRIAETERPTSNHVGQPPNLTAGAWETGLVSGMKEKIDVEGSEYDMAGRKTEIV